METEDLRRRLAEREAEVAELRQRLDREVAALNRIVEITALLNSTLRLDELLDLIIRHAAELSHAETGSLLLVEAETGDLTFAYATGDSDGSVKSSRVPAGQGIAGWVALNAEPLRVDDPQSDPRFYSGIDDKTGTRTRNLLAVPLRTRDAVIGVVEVMNHRSEGGFSSADQRIVGTLADQAAIAIENARMYASLADAVVASRMSYRL